MPLAADLRAVADAAERILALAWRPHSRRAVPPERSALNDPGANSFRRLSGLAAACSTGCAARIAGCRRGGSIRPRRACRCGRSAAPRASLPSASWMRSVRSMRGLSPSSTPMMSSTSSPLSFKRLPRRAVLELQRQHAHADQVRAVDALEALDDHRLDPEQQRALGRPVARRAGAVFLAAEDRPAARRASCIPSPRRRSASPCRPACSLVMPPSTPGTISLRMRMLAKVPRIITLWLPRRAP